MKRLSLFSLTVFMVALWLAGCGSGSKAPVQMTGTSVALQTRDAVNDQIVKFELTVSSITLTGANGTANTGNLLRGQGEVEFSHEAASFELLSLGNVPSGTYSGATMTVSNPEVVAIIGGVSTQLSATLSSTTVNVTFSPNITIGTSPAFLNFDLDLANSVTISGTPPSATVSPKFNVSTSTVALDQNSQTDENGGIQDLHGSVTGITAPNFTIQTQAASITFATNSNTVFQGGISQLTDLKVGDIVEVDGFTKPDGTQLATQVEKESDRQGEEVEGLISALFGSPLANITVIDQMDSTGSPNPPLTVDVGVNASTVYRVRTDKLSISPLPFDATHIGKGQRIEVDTLSSVGPIVAARVKLREQALIGTVAASPAPTSSGFTLNVSPTSAFGVLSGATTVPVTFASGATLKITPTAGATIRVRGLVFFDSSTGYSMIAVRDDNNQ